MCDQCGSPLPKRAYSPHYVARVALDLSLDQILEYSVPNEFNSFIRVGARVEVSVRNQLQKGYVLALVAPEEALYKGALKPIARVCIHEAVISEKLLRLGRFMADYYCCAYESAIRTLLPGSVRSGKVKRKTFDVLEVADSDAVRAFIAENAKKKKRQCAILEALLEAPTGVLKRDFVETHAISPAVMKALLETKLIAVESRTLSEFAEKTAGPARQLGQPLDLMPEQFEALQTINAMVHASEKGEHRAYTILLHGVTGSGKTEVYLQAIAEVLKMGKEALMLVPEIALTPQTVRRFHARFGDKISVLHSALTPSERFEQWTRINKGEVKIAVGARSVLFAPFENLGLIIVDEEHETSYKQSEAPRYNARDVAVMRGYMEHAVVLLGSATPALESYYNALNGRYALLRLRERADGAALPDVHIVDMRMEVDNNGPCIFSKALVEAIYQRLSAKEQVILFLNRRGYARQMQCEMCGYVPECPDCSVSYAYHMNRQILMCHYCGRAVSAPKVCPQCGDERIRLSGSGTEKIEQIAQKLFPSARIARMDSDTMNTAAAYEETLGAFGAGKIDILLGTQMIAKGLHFPRVTLVGILNADMSLFIPDFRADERTFQLITQVAGRAGRGGLPGEVIVQTRAPDNPAILCALKHDYEAFYQGEIAIREELAYPPFTRCIAVYFRGENLNEVEATAHAFYAKLKPFLHAKITPCPPAPAPIERIKGKYRYLITFFGTNLEQLRAAIRHELCHGKYSPRVDLYADCDPVSLL